MLSWYHSTNTDAVAGLSAPPQAGAQFTCVTGTKVQVLTQKRYAGVDVVDGDSITDELSKEVAKDELEKNTIQVRFLLVYLRY